MSLNIWILLLITIVFAQQDGFDTSQLSLLKNVRSQITFPKYSVSDRSIIVEQASKLFTMYTNTELKIKQYGIHVNPIPRLNILSQNLVNISDYDFHMKMFQIFADLRDLHQTYAFPGPYACYRVLLPLQFTRVSSNNSHMYVVSKKYDQYYDIFGSNWLDEISIGDVLSSVDGIGINAWVEDMKTTFSGANDEAGYSRAIEGIFYRSLAYRPLPNRDSVTLGLVGKSGIYVQTLDYLAYPSSMQCINPPQIKGAKISKPFSLDNAEYIQGTEYNQVFDTPSASMEGLGVLDSLQNITEFIRYTKLNYFWGTYGYINIINFIPNLGDYSMVINQVQQVLVSHFKDTNGLIIDVRNNPGGSIQLAEGLLQLFSSSYIVPTTMRARNTRLNKLIFESGNSDFENTKWKDIFKTTPENYTFTYPGISLSETEYELANQFGRAYFEPVSLLTNAKCFSACELFTAGMQDWNLAKIYGEDKYTGGGGCNVMENWNFHKYIPDEFVLSLPGYQSMRLAWRQTQRSGKNKGILIEDAGITVDDISQPIRSDITGKSQTQLDQISYNMRLQNLFMKHPSINVDGELIRDVPINDPITFFGYARGVGGIVAKENGESIGGSSVSKTGHNWKLHLQAPVNFSTSRRIFFEAYGKNGKYLFRVERAVRVIPNRIEVLKRHPHIYNFRKPYHWNWDFEIGKTAAVYMLSETDIIDGWNVLGNKKLVIGDGFSYKPGVKSVFSLFLNMKHVRNATVSVHLSLDLAPMDKLTFEVAKPPSPLAIEWFGDQTGKLPPSTLSFNLDRFCGNEFIEFRIVFKSKRNSITTEYRGPSIFGIDIVST